MEPISLALIMKSLDGLSLRTAVTAQNIANANSPGYRPQRVTFEDALRLADGPAAIARVEPQIVANENRALRVDLELATATTTAGRYGALVELLNRQLQIEAVAASGAR